MDQVPGVGDRALLVPPPGGQPRLALGGQDLAYGRAGQALGQDLAAGRKAEPDLLGPGIGLAVVMMGPRRPQRAGQLGGQASLRRQEPGPLSDCLLVRRERYRLARRSEY